MFNFQNTIGSLLFKKIFIGYILIVILIASYQVFIQYKFAKEIINKDFKTIEKVFTPILSQSLWQFDDEALITETNSIVNFALIDGVSILDLKEKIFTQKGYISKRLKNLKKTQIEDDLKVVYQKDLLEYSFKLFYISNNKREDLGKVILFLKKDRIFEILKENVYLIVFNVIVSAFVLWVLFMYFTNKLLTIPLERLINATKELGEKHNNHIELSFNTNKKHELNKLNINFNRMVKKINEVINDLIKQKRALKLANKSKDDFLANMSHELKTPLNAINVISSTMMKNKKNLLDEDSVKNMRIINSCGNDLLFLINDVLDISKLEAGEITLDMREVDFKKLMFSIKDMIAPQAEIKEISFLFQYDEKIGNIYSDENRIKQIVKNILSNALKFVQKGRIDFIVKDDNDFVRIIVKDDGIGIKEDKLEHIFDRFKQADGSTTRKYGGTGLGLAICKELLSLLKGEIIVESKVGVGTTFYIQIPKNKDKIISSSTILNEDEKKVNKKENLLILNNDHISFINVVVSLKKHFYVDNIVSIDEFVKLEKQKNYKYLIVDITSLDLATIEQLLTGIVSKIIIVYKNENITTLNKFTDKFIKKPINIEELLAMLN